MVEIFVSLIKGKTGVLLVKSLQGIRDTSRVCVCVCAEYLMYM